MIDHSSATREETVAGLRRIIEIMHVVVDELRDDEISAAIPDDTVVYQYTLGRAAAFLSFLLHDDAAANQHETSAAAKEAVASLGHVLRVMDQQPPSIGKSVLTSLNAQRSWMEGSIRRLHELHLV